MMADQSKILSEDDKYEANRLLGTEQGEQRWFALHLKEESANEDIRGTRSIYICY
jgi:hypothetical protein